MLADAVLSETEKSIDHLLAILDGAGRAALDKLIAPELQEIKSRLWAPDSRNKPQCQAYSSLADLMLYGGSAGGGKALELDTPIPTPSDWTTMAELRIGDLVFDETGKQCHVVGVSPVMIGRQCFEVVFSDGCSVICDADHGWFTHNASERTKLQRHTPSFRAKRREKRPLRGTGKRPDVADANAKRLLPPQVPFGGVRTTIDVAQTLYGWGGRLNHSVSLNQPLVCDAAELPIDPYLFGAWLGDGSSRGARIAIAEAEMVSLVADAASAHQWSVTKGSGIYDYGVTGGLKVALRSIGVLGTKAIPQTYLRASIDQRIALLQGLMDTDGYVDARGQCEFTTTSEILALGTLELIRSLGSKAQITVGEATLKGRVIGPKYRIKFLATFSAFRLSRKRDKQKTGQHRPTVARRYIEDVREVPSVPVRCIQVDSQSRLYLCGRGMIPTHNSDLLIGTALTQHKRSVIFRRQNVDLGDIAERIIQLAGRDGWNGMDKVLSRPEFLVELGHLEKPGSELSWQGGLGHDFIGFDEGAQLLKHKVQFVLGWLRSTEPGQRCRAVIASNPPTSDEGTWLIEWFAPWLDPGFPRPAKAGELRLAVSAPDSEGTTVWIDEPSPVIFETDTAYRKATPDEIAANDRRIRTPKSRTFIPAQLSDNPFLADTEYRAQLQSMPEPLRTQLLTGDFLAGRKDHERQLIPSAWIDLAMERWRADAPKRAMTAMGVDVAQGGDDQTVIAVRYGGWFDHLVKKPGAECRESSAVAAAILSKRRDQCPVVIDLGGGFGGDALGLLERQGIPCTGYLGNRPSNATTREGRLKFYNRRAEDWWRMREELDPNQEHGSAIALPPDPVIKADLTAPRIKDMNSTRGILIEEKADIKKRLGRSPDAGDAIVMALNEGGKAVVKMDRERYRDRRPERANVGHSDVKQRFGR